MATLQALDDAAKLATFQGYDGFLKALAYWQLGDKAAAQEYFELARAALNSNYLHDPELRRLGAEAALTIGLPP